jgi:hypothetical protein
MRPRLFHVSEDAGIERFTPRPIPSPDSGVAGLAVWAVAESHLANYLLPRDCPRICFRAGPLSSISDVERFLRGAGQVVAFEREWLERARTTELTLYEMPGEEFEEVLPEAGYWIARGSVNPIRVVGVGDLMHALERVGAEVRVIDHFWPLADAVAQSTLQVSIIRKRNARPRAG